MLYWEIIAVCSDIHAKQRNTLCGRNVEFFLRQNLAVGRESTELQSVNWFFQKPAETIQYTELWRYSEVNVHHISVNDRNDI